MADQPEAPQAAKPKSKKLYTALILLAIMAAEGGVIFGAMRFFGASPVPAAAHEVDSEEGQGQDTMAAGHAAEVLIAETDAFSNRSGRLYVYHLQVKAVVKSVNQETIKKLVEERAGTISDRISTVIRGADPEHLNEPGLETIRRQIQFELDKILGDEALIEELLIPRLLQSRAGL